MSGKKFIVADLETIEDVPCPCGSAKRAFMEDGDGVASLHVTTIKEDSQVHYHKRMTEIYYVLEGEGTIELDGESHPLRPGVSVMIKPGCRHRAVGKQKIINVPVP